MHVYTLLKYAVLHDYYEARPLRMGRDLHQLRQIYTSYAKEDLGSVGSSLAV